MTMREIEMEVMTAINTQDEDEDNKKEEKQKSRSVAICATLNKTCLLIIFAIILFLNELIARIFNSVNILQLTKELLQLKTNKTQ